MSRSGPRQDRHRPPPHRQRGAEQDAAGAGQRAEVEQLVDVDAAAADPPEAVHRPRAARRGDVARDEQDADQDGDAHAGGEQPQPELRQPLGPARAPQHQRHHQRPQQVELLLHGQRPQVPQRGERRRRRVPLADGDLVPVAAVGDRPDEVAASLTLRCRVEEREVDRRADEEDDERRQQPTGSPQPEALETDGALALVLADQQQRDQVAADHEEHLDPEETTRQPRVIGVVDDHRQHGERADPVEPRRIGQSTDLRLLGARRRPRLHGRPVWPRRAED
ncbi:MAG: hypothetical protein QM733_07700 [Ilumatobacteraceae bacterium]